MKVLAKEFDDLPRIESLAQLVRSKPRGGIALLPVPDNANEYIPVLLASNYIGHVKLHPCEHLVPLLQRGAFFATALRSDDLKNAAISEHNWLLYEDSANDFGLTSEQFEPVAQFEDIPDVIMLRSSSTPGGLSWYYIVHKNAYPKIIVA